MAIFPLPSLSWCSLNPILRFIHLPLQMLLRTLFQRPVLCSRFQHQQSLSASPSQLALSHSFLPHFYGNAGQMWRFTATTPHRQEFHMINILRPLHSKTPVKLSRPCFPTSTRLPNHNVRAPRAGFRFKFNQKHKNSVNHLPQHWFTGKSTHFRVAGLRRVVAIFVIGKDFINSFVGCCQVAFINPVKEMED